VKYLSRMTCLVAWACLFTTSTSTLGEAAPAPLLITVATLWEGEPVSEANMEALRSFRKSHAGTGMIYFVSPAYLAREARDRRAAEDQQRAILATMEKNDIAGIYLNGWKSTVEASNVVFRNAPTFWGNSLNARQCADDCGREVVMAAYTGNELRKIIRRSRELFSRNGFGSGSIMQVAGHAASPEVLGAAAAEGITHDFSAVAAELMTGRLYRFPLRKQLRELWSGVGPMMSPFQMETGSGSITQMTSNGLHLEYSPEPEIRNYLDRLFGKGGAANEKIPANRHIYIGVPAETFAIARPKLELAMNEIIQRASDSKTALRWTAEAIPGAGDNKPVLPSPMATVSPTPSPTPSSKPSQTPTPSDAAATGPGPAGEAH